MNNSIKVDVSQQKLFLLAGDDVIAEYPCGTAAKGTGQQQGSWQTPLGKHEVVAKIGEGCDPNAVFVGREPTGEIYSAALAAEAGERDWILGRILWLGGLEPGVNQGGEVDTQARYIYIHGSPDSVMLNAPASKGCINMYARDIVALFIHINIGCLVEVE